MISRAMVLPTPALGCSSAEARKGVRFGVTAGHLLILALLAVSTWWQSLQQFKPPSLTVQLVTSTQMAQVKKQAQKDLLPELPPEPVPPEPEPPEPIPPPPEPTVPEVKAIPKPPAPAPAPKPPVPKPVEVKTPAPKPPLPKPVEVKTPAPKLVEVKPAPAAVKTPAPPKETTADRVRRIREAFVKPKRPVLARLPAPAVAPLSAPSAADIAERINASVRNLQVAVAANVNVQEDSPQRTRDWFAALTQQLYAVWRQPSRVTVGGGQPKVAVKLVVRANGQVVSAQVSRSSGVTTMDASVERTLAALKQVVAPSAYGIRNSSMPVEVQFELD